MIEPAATTPEAEAVTSFDPCISTAFATGWETASLFRGASFDRERPAEGRDDLPGLGALSPGERTELAIDMIEANLRKLDSRLTAATPVDKARIERLREVLATSPEDPGALRQAVARLHIRILFSLSAADFLLGRAYGLGHALADTCKQAEDRSSFERAFGTRLVAVKDSLADLASSFPPHSSRAVVLSLRAWEAWAADPRLGDEALDWPRHGAGVRAALRRQGELWRDLLSAEKLGTDMLSTSHYLRAASSLVATMSSTVRRFLRPFRGLLAAMALLILVGVGLLLFTGSLGQVVGAISVAAGALGITSAGVRARLGKVATRLEARLWGAELDLAIAEAVLIGPAGWGVSVTGDDVPATGAVPKVATDLETLRKFRQAIGDGQVQDARDLLAPDAEFVAGSEAKRGRDAVAEWLPRAAQSTHIASEPQRLVAVRPGVLMAYVGSGADVWRVQEGKVRHWQSFADDGEAHTVALALAAGRRVAGAAGNGDRG